MQEKIKVLKVRFDQITLEEASILAISWAKEHKKRYICTPNPEFLLEATKNSKFLDILNASDLNIPDGTGVLWASAYLDSTKNTKSKFIKILKIIQINLRIILPERVTGADLMQKICEKSAKKGLKIFLLGAREGIAEAAKSKLEQKYPSIKIVGTFAGTPNVEDDEKIIKIINNGNPNILFVAYGAPKQEFWIDRNLKKLHSVNLAIGVGGSFDFISGKKKRAPKWMQNLGIEWVYRLIQEPKRIKRIFNATLKFPFIVIKRNLQN